MTVYKNTSSDLQLLKDQMALTVAELPHVNYCACQTIADAGFQECMAMV
jgi:hypothetical protein